MIELSNRWAVPLSIDTNSAHVVDGTATNDVGILGQLSPSFGSTSHANGRPWMSTMQIRVVNDAIFDEVTRAFDLQGSVHCPFDQQSLQHIVFTGDSHVPLHLQCGLAIWKNLGSRWVEKTAIADDVPATFVQTQVAAPKLDTLNNDVAGIFCFETGNATFHSHFQWIGIAATVTGWNE